MRGSSVKVSIRLALLIFVAISLANATHNTSAASKELVIYSDSLAEGWEDWSWDTKADLQNKSPVHIGSQETASSDSASIAVSYQKPDAGLKLHTNTLVNPADYDSLYFWINGGKSGVKIQVLFEDKDDKAMGRPIMVTLPADIWVQVTITLDTVGSLNEISAIDWADATSSVQPTFYLDDIKFLLSDYAPPSTPAAAQPGPALTVDVTAGQHLISPMIYGMNWADEALAKELRLPVRRWGGNATTRYSWKYDTSNRAADWYFKNVPEDNDNTATLPDGSAADKFVAQNLRTNTETLLTIPMIGWTPNGRNYKCGFSVAKYGPQKDVEQESQDCGNGIKPDDTPITGNDPTDTSVQIDPGFVQDWMRHLIKQFGTAGKGGVRFYGLDNEPDLWNVTQWDVYPKPVSYDDLVALTIKYAAAIKEADPAAQTFGPVVSGWTYYFYSALDALPGGNWWENPLDQKAHDNLALVEWYLQQMHDYEQSHNVRLLDYLDLHFYPQADGVTLTTAGGPATQALRLRSTRALWDPTYKDESWINDTVMLIPRMRDWVAKNYPGTKLAISEYNWGGLESINGALAQADVLGIFGREGLDLATLWSPPDPDQPGAFAFRMYRNYDGKGGGFGDTSISAISADQGKLAIYAASRKDGALTLMIINKSVIPLTSTIAIKGAAGKLAQVFQYSGAAPGKIAQEAGQPVNEGAVSITFPSSSITLLVVG